MSWSVLQSAVNGANSAGTTSTVSVTFGTNLSSGTKLIAAVIADYGATRHVATVADGSGNQFTEIASQGYSSGNGESGLWAIDTPAGDVGTTPTITATVNTAGSGDIGLTILVQEVSGLATGSTVAAMIDGTPGLNHGTGGASAGSPAYSSTIVNEYLVAVYGDQGTGPETWTKPAALTADPNSINSSITIPNCAIAYGNSTGGAESGAWALSGTSAKWANILCAFKLATTAITSTGSIALAPMGLAGVIDPNIEDESGAFILDESGANVLDESGAAGITTATGSLALAPMGESGNASSTGSTAGSLSLAPMSMSGTGTVVNPVTSTGSLTLAPMRIRAGQIILVPSEAYGTLTVKEYSGELGILERWSTLQVSGE